MQFKFLIYIYLLTVTNLYGEWAVIRVPIADLLGQSLKTMTMQHHIPFNYYTLPISGKTQPFSCPRIHQLLFNEIVEIEKTEGPEVMIHTPHVFYETSGNNAQFSTFWTLKKNIICFSELNRHGIKMHTIPQPINGNLVQKDMQQKIVVLKEPFTDSTTKCTFSVGTRFVLTGNQHEPKNFLVYTLTFHPTPHTIILSIPKHLAILEKKSDNSTKRQQFVSLIRSWIQQKGFIPYVWGGTSFTTTCAEKPFELIQHKTKYKVFEYFKRPSNTSYPCAGFDCAGLIMRTAQLVGLPFPYKNSYTIRQHLSPLSKHELLKAGDIIWFNGHVMIVADIQRNTIFESRSYMDGYGKVHEIPLNIVFKNIQTFEQLKSACFNKKTLERLDCKGETCRIIDQFKLLKLTT